MNRPRATLALAVLAMSGATAAALVVTACGSFSGASESADAAASEGSTPDASTGTEASIDGATADGAVPEGGLDCTGKTFGAVRSIQDDLTLHTVTSVRGAPGGITLLSWDTSPDENMEQAVLAGGVLKLSTPNAFAPQSTSDDETHPTASSTLDLVVFASNRPIDGNASTSFHLWMSKLEGGAFTTATALEVAGALVSANVTNPYLAADDLLFFELDGELRYGQFDKGTRKVSTPLGVPGVAAGGHPVVSRNGREIFVQVPTGVAMASRPAPAAGSFGTQTKILSELGAYPSWISDDACHLYVIHNTADGRGLLVFDRN